jgi:hypothetical protein
MTTGCSAKGPSLSLLVLHLVQFIAGLAGHWIFDPRGPYKGVSPPGHSQRPNSLNQGRVRPGDGRRGLQWAARLNGGADEATFKALLARLTETIKHTLETATGPGSGSSLTPRYGRRDTVTSI